MYTLIFFIGHCMHLLLTNNYIQPIVTHNRIINGKYVLISSNINFAEFLSDPTALDKSAIISVFLIDLETTNSSEALFYTKIYKENKEERPEIDNIVQIYSVLNIKTAKYFIFNVGHMALYYLLDNKTSLSFKNPDDVQGLFTFLEYKFKKTFNKFKMNGEVERNKQRADSMSYLDGAAEDLDSETVKRIMLQNKLLHIADSVVMYDDIAIEMHGIDPFYKGGNLLKGLTKLSLKRPFIFCLDQMKDDSLLNKEIQFWVRIDILAELIINENNEIEMVKNKTISFFKHSESEKTGSFAIYGERNPLIEFRKAFRDVWTMLDRYEKDKKKNNALEMV